MLTPLQIHDLCILLTLKKFHENFDSCELLHDVATMEVTKQENKRFREKSKRTGTLTAAKAALLKEELDDEVNYSLKTTKAKELDMDHVYVKFTDFLWAYTFIGPFSYLLWKRRTIILQFRKFLQNVGLINPMAKCDYEALAATLCLEQTQAIHFYGQTSKDSKLGNIAGNVPLPFGLVFVNVKIICC